MLEKNETTNMATYHTQKREVTTARYAGGWYLIMAISGILGFMIFHPKVFVTGHPEETLANLINHGSLSRIRLLFEFVIIVSQALAAAWLYKLFKNINEWAAWTVGIWGMMNAAVIMVSAISMGSAIEIANSASQPYEDKVVLIELLGNLISNAWGVGGLFFGLWLIPMGYIVLSSKRMPIWLGRTLIFGGVGYLLSTFFNYAGMDNPFVAFLVIPATVGEFWMIGYLLIYGIRPSKEKIETSL